MSPRVSLIAAVADNGVIGLHGGMPWKLSTDLRRFKALTRGKPVVMGRVTFEGLKGPLADRLNIVVTGRPRRSRDGVVYTNGIVAAFAAADDPPPGIVGAEIMVIGGAAIYRETIGIADRLYITHIHAAPQGDASFPRIDPARWQALLREDVPAGPKDDFPTSYVVYERRDPPPAVDGDAPDPQLWRDGDVRQLLSEAEESRSLD